MIASPVSIIRARSVAEKLVALLAENCERIEIAGSIRRGKPEVKDIELVAIPRLAERSSGLFGEPGEASGLDIALFRHQHEDNVAGLITCWYAAHLARGGAPDPVQEAVIAEALSEFS